MNLHLQLRYRHPPSPLRQPIPIPPLRLQELRTVHHNLIQLPSGSRMNCPSNDVDPRAETKHEACVLAVQDEITPREEDLAGRGDSHGG